MLGFSTFDGILSIEKERIAKRCRTRQSYELEFYGSGNNYIFESRRTSCKQCQRKTPLIITISLVLPLYAVNLMTWYTEQYY